MAAALGLGLDELDAMSEEEIMDLAERHRFRGLTVSITGT